MKKKELAIGTILRRASKQYLPRIPVAFLNVTGSSSVYTACPEQHALKSSCAILRLEKQCLNPFFIVLF